MILLTNGFRISSTQHEKKHAILVTAVLLIVLLIIAAPLIMGMHPGKNTDLGRSPLILTYIALDLVLLALVFLITVTLRNELVPATWHWLREKIGIPIYTGAIIVCLGFLSYNIFPLGISASGWGKWTFFCLPVLFSGFVFYTLFFTLLLRLGKWKHINFAGILFFVCIIINISAPTKYHNVRFRKSKVVPAYSSKDRLENYFVSWVMHRKKEIDI